MTIGQKYNVFLILGELNSTIFYGVWEFSGIAGDRVWFENEDEVILAIPRHPRELKANDNWVVEEVNS